MRTIVKVNIRTYRIWYKVGSIYTSLRAYPLRMGTYWNMDQNTGKQCVQQGKHRNAMSEHRIGTGTRIRTGTGTGTKLEREILRAALVIPEFECGTKFWESQESV